MTKGSRGKALNGRVVLASSGTEMLVLLVGVVAAVGCCCCCGECGSAMSFFMETAAANVCKRLFPDVAGTVDGTTPADGGGVVDMGSCLIPLA